MPPKWALGFAQCRGMLTREDLTREIATGYIERYAGWTDPYKIAANPAAAQAASTDPVPLLIKPIRKQQNQVRQRRRSLKHRE